MRLGKACLQCRNGKRRCEREESGTACKQCTQRRLICSSLNITRFGQHSDPSPSSPATSTAVSIAGPHEDAVHTLVDLYFTFMHDKPHTLFHEPSFKESVYDGSVSRTVLLSMKGLSARFAKDPSLRLQSWSYTHEAKELLKDDLEHVCIENIQACILIGNICLGDCESDAESLYFVLANRMAQILRLSVVDDTDDGITRETKLRVYWSCFIIDTWSSGGSGLPRQFQIRNHGPRVPMDETTFNRLRPGDPDIVASQRRPGLWGHMVGLVQIYSQIQDLNKYLAEAPEWDEDSIEDAVRGIAVQLVAFEDSLPQDMRYSWENLSQHVERGLGRLFIAFLLGYEHYATLLFYQYLDQQRPPTTNGKAYADRCKYHAMKFCEILRASRAHGEAEALYNIVGHITVVSSSVLLHTFLFGDVDELPDARRRLESNFESLVQLRTYWSSVELMINRLVIFQNSCLRSATTNTHRFDKWMVKFLLQHALALDEKVEDIRPPTIDEGALPRILTIEEKTLIERSRVTQSIITDMRHVSD